MQAVILRKTKGLVVENLPLPQPDEDQVLVKVLYTGFCGSDHSLIENEGTPDGIILGHEVCGMVIEAGRKVRGVRPGTRVIIRPTFCQTCPGCLSGRPQLCSNNRRSIGIGDLPGGFAEFILAYPRMLIPVPEQVDSKNAALTELCAVSLHGIRVSGRETGSASVLGGGAIGLSLVKLLKLHNFFPIVVSEPMKEKRKLALEFGADIVIDPLTENLVLQGYTITKGAGFNVVFECSGRKGLVPEAMNLAGPAGTICQLSVVYENIEINPAVLMFKELKLTAAYGNTHEENRQCLRWMSEGKLDVRPLITDMIALDELPQVYKERIHIGKTIKVLVHIGE
ncbi:MAG: alcohol dehydrogenase catalytic domain-containing protein [Deltaproteobacteria bacterium]|nr:alcohol dehydrogenase catalytic domain-containing protein [Deltaproteobacteria bacterium]